MAASLQRVKEIGTPALTQKMLVARAFIGGLIVNSSGVGPDSWSVSLRGLAASLPILALPNPTSSQQQ
jgi:hypothetical protein